VVHVPCPKVPIPRFLVFLFPGERNGVKTHVFRADSPSCFMCWLGQLVLLLSIFGEAEACSSKLMSFKTNSLFIMLQLIIL
jgi:hypothetical protein